MQPVKIALAEGQLTILDSGVQPGQKVVVDGADRLRAGQIVTASVGQAAAAARHAGQAAGAGLRGSGCRSARRQRQSA